MKNIFKILTILLLHQLVWSQSNTITSYQYWVDNDFSNQQSISISPVSEFHLQTDLDLSSTEQGFHTFHIRFQDNNNKYSAILSQLFFSRSLDTKITAYEYWFDNNYSAKVNVAVSPAVNLQLITDFDCASLTNGMHLLHLRFKDDGGKWSSVTSKFFQKSANGSSTVNLITSYRYWIDSSYNAITSVNLSNPVNPYELINDFDMTQVPKGQHTFNIQFKDTSGLWSAILTDTIVKNALPISNFDFTTTATCDSTVLNLSNLSMDADSYLWDFGDGIQSTDSLPLHSYHVAGVYDITLTVTDLLSGLGSTITKTVVINGHTTSTISLEACEQQNSPSGLYTWTSSGQFMDTIQNAVGCDSVITVNLTINNNTTNTISPSACNSYTAPDGQIYTQSGTYTAVIPTVESCDSTITINLTINELNNAVTQTDLTLTATQIGAQYQWIDCANGNIPIVNETNQTFTAQTNGSYAVIVTTTDCSDTSECIQISNVGIMEASKDLLQLFPNPTSDYLTIKTNQAMYFDINVLDVNGKIILTKTQNKNEATIDVSTLPKGLYMLRVTSQNFNITNRITKM